MPRLPEALPQSTLLSSSIFHRAPVLRPMVFLNRGKHPTRCPPSYVPPAGESTRTGTYAVGGVRGSAAIAGRVFLGLSREGNAPLATLLNLAASFVKAEKDTLLRITQASGSTPSITGLQAQSLTELLPF